MNSEMIYLNLGNGKKCAAIIIERLSARDALVEFDQAGIGRVRSMATLEQGKWYWDWDYETDDD